MNKTKAIQFLIGLFSLVTVFHMLVILQIIPYSIVWAGKLNSTEYMYVFESISIAINLLLMGILIVKRKHIQQNINNKLLNGVLWFFCIVFALNTLGNLTSKTLLEKALFTPLTLISSVLFGVIAKKEKANSN
jgi:hypothetical protein